MPRKHEQAPKHKKPLVPVCIHPNLTSTQTSFLRSKSDYKILTGCAGTGKTYIAMVDALRALQGRDVERVVVIRSAVPTRDIGFLPGTVDEKMAAYEDAYGDLIKSITPQKTWRQYIGQDEIQFAPTSFLRGVTFDDAYVILDEYQNLTAHEIETVVTRVGDSTRLTLCGDSEQSDLTGRDKNDHKSVLDVLSRMPEFKDSWFEFGIEDIVRSKFVKSFFTAKSKKRDSSH